MLSPSRTRAPSAWTLPRTHTARSSSGFSRSMIDPPSAPSSSRELERMMSSTWVRLRTELTALPTVTRAASSLRRLERAAVSTRSSSSRRVRRRRWTSFSSTYRAKPMVRSTRPTRTGRCLKSPTDVAPDDAMSTKPADRAAMTTNATSQSCQRLRSTASSEGVEKSRRPTTFASRASSCRLAAMPTYRRAGERCLGLWTYKQRSIDLVGSRVDVEVDRVLADLAGGDAADPHRHGGAAQLQLHRALPLVLGVVGDGEDDLHLVGALLTHAHVEAQAAAQAFRLLAGDDRRAGDRGLAVLGQLDGEGHIRRLLAREHVGQTLQRRQQDGDEEGAEQSDERHPRAQDRREHALVPYIERS